MASDSFGMASELFSMISDCFLARKNVFLSKTYPPPNPLRKGRGLFEVAKTLLRHIFIIWEGISKEANFIICHT